MLLAFVDNFPGAGGLSRFSLLLCKSLLEEYPQLKIDYFIHSSNISKMRELTSFNRVTIFELKTTRQANLMTRFYWKALSWMGINVNYGEREIMEIEQRVDSRYDLAYFPTAHMMRRPNLSIAVVGTLHDFNWKYFFGQEIFTHSFVEMMDREILLWLNNGFTISSSLDVVSEAKKLYPKANRFPTVVHIAAVVFENNIDENKANQILREFKIDFPYIIFPANFFPHKNHLNLFTAFAMLKKRSGFENHKLILTGLNSQQIPLAIAEERGIQIITKNSVSGNPDIIGMGYLPNEVMDILIKKATLLVSPSIYEAICTPGMDAWNFGTPTAISDIPPFREHEKVWGIRTAFFDPKDPKNIADVIEEYLRNYPAAKSDANISQANMRKYSWSKVAEGYMAVFREAIEKWKS